MCTKAISNENFYYKIDDEDNDDYDSDDENYYEDFDDMVSIDDYSCFDEQPNHQQAPVQLFSKSDQLIEATSSKLNGNSTFLLNNPGKIRKRKIKTTTRLDLEYFSCIFYFKLVKNFH